MLYIEAEEEGPIPSRRLMVAAVAEAIEQAIPAQQRWFGR